MNKSRLWVLGASDPEMTAIERLLTETGERIAYAAGSDGKRVHPGNAYAAIGRVGHDLKSVPMDSTLTVTTEHIYVECSVLGNPNRNEWTYLTGLRGRRIDHHRCGDPGYGRPPEEFLDASSIGQVISELGRLGRIPGDWNSIGCAGINVGRFWSSSDGDWFVGIGQLLPCDNASFQIPLDLVLIAAADQCLEAAYRGRCPGVKPDALMRWRVESRAAFQGRTVSAVLADVEAARKRLLDAAVEGYYVPLGPAGGDDMDYEHIALADLRGENIPELPEAAAREGVPFLATVKDRDGREKVVLQSASPELVQRFLAGEIVPGLVDRYGDPARAFAGGYIA